MQPNLKVKQNSSFVLYLLSVIQYFKHIIIIWYLSYKCVLELREEVARWIARVALLCDKV